MLSKRIMTIQSQIVTVNPVTDTIPLSFPKSPKPLSHEYASQNEQSNVTNKIHANIQYDNSIPLSSSPMTERFIHQLSKRLTTY